MGPMGPIGPMSPMGAHGAHGAHGSIPRPIKALTSNNIKTSNVILKFDAASIAWMPSNVQLGVRWIHEWMFVIGTHVELVCETTCHTLLT